MRPDAGTGPAFGQPETRHRRADAAAPGPRMYDQLGHGGGVGNEVQVADDLLDVLPVVDGKQVPCAVTGQLPQHLIADRRDTVMGARGGDQVTDPPLLGIRKHWMPADRRSRRAGGVGIRH